MAQPLQIHVWPAAWDLPSFDPACLEAILYLQLSFPGHFSIVEEVNPDLSPTGQLPYLTHLEHSIAPVSSIISYVSSLNPASISSKLDDEAYQLIPSLDAALSAADCQQAVVWRAFVHAHVGDLVAHSFYSFYPNYSSVMRPLLASILPWPQKFYVPGRLRDMHKPRLEAATFWEEEEEETATPQSLTKSDSASNFLSVLRPSHFRKAFGKARTLTKAKEHFDLINRILDDDVLFFNDRPSSLDVVMASYILPILHAPLPEPFLQTLLRESYPRIVSHARLVFERAFPITPSDSRPTPSVAATRDTSIINALASAPSALSRMFKAKYSSRSPNFAVSESDAERRLRLGRWLWSGFAVVGLLGYALSQGILVIEPTRVEEGRDSRDEA